MTPPSGPTPVLAPAGRVAEQPLLPVREFLLRRARDDAAAIVAAATRDAAATTAAARRRAAETLAAARSAGEADGAVAAGERRARMHRQARRIVQAARRDAYHLLLDRCRSAAGALKHEPGYPELLARLTEAAAAAAGKGARVTERPAGGVVAEGGGRRVDLTLDRLAVRAVEELGSEVEQLWTT
jgi:hypothetical protein